MSVINIIAAVLILALCVLIHELGHFLSALALGIPVEEFSIGFGPKLCQFKFKGIKYSLRLIFLGGYVRYYMDESDVVGREDSDIDKIVGDAGDKSYMKQPAWKRFICAFCGPFMNAVLAFVATIIIYSMIGNPVVVPRVAEYSTDSAAYAAGIQAGDIIVSVNGQDVSYDEAGTQRVRDAIAASDGQPIGMVVERGGEQVSLSITPAYSESAGRYMIGTTFGTAYSPCSPFEAVSRAGRFIVQFTGEMYKSLGSIFTSKQPITDQLTGPVGTVQIISEQVSKGGMETLQTLMMISLNLGILNLLPIPGLDGFKLLLLVIEMIRKKPVPPKREAMISLIGLALLFGLMIFVTYNDVARLITGG